MGLKKTIASLLIISTSNLAFVGCESSSDNRRMENLYFQQRRLMMEQYEKDLESIKKGLPTSDEMRPTPRSDAEYLYGPGSNLRSLERQERDRWRY